jgi:two-component system LytT family response regulator
MTHDQTLIHALVVDDEALARRGIRQLLAAHPDITVVGECRNGREALAALETHTLDLMFLDVQMPELDGFGVVREALAARGAERLPVTVFLTAFEEFALDAFGVEATDYLVKPVSEERFDTTMKRVRRRLAATGVPGAAATAEPHAARHLVIVTAHGQRIVLLDDIEWIGADDYYAAVHAGGRRHLLRESLASLEERLDMTRFVRVHRGAIVNVTRIREVRTANGDTAVILRDGTRIPVSRRRRSALVSALG